MGLEEVLSKELESLGATDIEILKRAVSCEGDLTLLYKANLWLRTGIRILVPIKKFEVLNEQDLYDQLLEVNWEEYLNLDQTFVVDVVTLSESMNHSHFLSLKTKDAIVDWFRERTRKRPNIDTSDPDIKFHVHINAKHECTLLLDSSGEGLHRRGYRTDGGDAPLNEVLAAGLIQLSGWKGDQPFVDMMCGSGTILIEAAMLAINKPPGMNRPFSFQNWPDYDDELWANIQKEASDQIKEQEHPIIGVDLNFKAIRVAEQNIEAAGLEDIIRVRRTNFNKYLPPEGPGVMIINPPYGLRIESDDIFDLYQEIGDKMKQDFSGYTAWILSGNFDALKHVGLRPKRKIPLLNGQLECKFQAYELYRGTKKIHKLKQ